jgi:hypothetical protein
LTGLAILGFITLPIRITTIYGGLPAHPLFVHVPVILIPSTVIAAIVLMVRTDWFARYGIALAVVSIGAMSSIFLTMQAGGALDAALHLRGRAAHLISDHPGADHHLRRPTDLRRHGNRAWARGSRPLSPGARSALCASR